MSDLKFVIERIYSILDNDKFVSDNLKINEVNISNINSDEYMKYFLGHFGFEELTKVARKIDRRLNVKYNISNGPSVYISIVYNSKETKTSESLQLMGDIIEHVCTIIKICENIFRKKRTCLSVLLFPSKLNKKKYENNVFEVKDVNSGYSFLHDMCSINNYDIVIYRKEEMFKVLIHEILHKYEIHLSNINNDRCSNLEKWYRDMYQINSLQLNNQLNLYESYVEFWTIIINCGIYAYRKTTTKNVFDDFFRKCLKKEQQYSKKLFYFILNDFKVKSKNNRWYFNKPFTENTNSFSYYILKYCLLLNIDYILSFLNRHYVLTDIDRYCEFFFEVDKLLQEITPKNKKNKKIKHMKMTCVDVKETYLKIS